MLSAVASAHINVGMPKIACPKMRFWTGSRRYAAQNPDGFLENEFVLYKRLCITKENQMIDDKLLNAISDITAKALNEQDYGAVAGQIDGLFAKGASANDREEALERALVYSLQAHQPGFPPDGQPGYLSSSASLKAAVLHEVDVMSQIDPDDDVNAGVWKRLKNSLESACEIDFVNGADINCPDDYILVLTPMSCGLVLRQRGALK